MIGNGIGFFTIVSNFVRLGFGGRAKSLAALFGLTIVLASCGGSSSSGSTAAPTASLTASPSTIVAGQNVTLTWASTNADMGTIDSGVGQVGLNGSTILTLNPLTPGYPTGTTTYTYTATGPGGTATASATVTVNLVTSFDGMVQSDWSGSGSNQDVDPNGAVGTKQYMEYINASYQAYDKITNQPVWPSPQPIKTLWANNPPCYQANGTTSAIQLDAVIIFDRLAPPSGRWVVAAKTSVANDFYFCIAVSSVDDLTSPSLTWGAYSFPLKSILGIDGVLLDLPDWPKVGTWSDGYYVTMDEVDQVLNQEVGVVVCVFDRPDILNNPGSIKDPPCVTVPPTSSTSLYLGHSLIPADVDGTTAPPAGESEFLVSIENPDTGATSSNVINLWQAKVTWGATTGTLTLTPSQLSVTSYTPGCYLYDPQNATITNCVPQPQNGSQELIDSVGDRLMPRFAYRNFGSYESYLVSHTVQTGPGASGNTPSAFQTGIRWYELRPSGGTLSVNNSGTINPDMSLFRFLPSIAQDKVGNVAVGYSISNVFTPPGIDFSYWSLPSATAPTELPIIQGLGEEITPGTGAGKWGSYSSMTVDPVSDCTFWYVNEYFIADDTWRTRIANFTIPGCQ